MPAIDKNVINYLEKLLANSNNVKNINRELQDIEPELVQWCQKQAQDDVTGFLRGGVFANPEIVSELGNRFIAARLAGYLLAQVGHTYKLCDELTLKISENGDISDDIDKEYEEWINGRLPKRYYNYKITETMRKSRKEETRAIVTAYDNYIKFTDSVNREKECKRKHEERKKILNTAKSKAGITEEKGEGNIINRIRRSKPDGPDLTIEDPGK